MFFAQSHNQVLYHLSQFVSAIGSKPIPLCIKTKDQNDHFRQNQNIGKNVTQASDHTYTLLEHIDITNVGAIPIKNNNVHTILNQLSSRIQKGALKNSKHWSSTKHTFMSNSNHFPCAALTEPILSPIIRVEVKQQHRTIGTFQIKNPLLSHMQARGFKTERQRKSYGNIDGFFSGFVKRLFDDSHMEKHKTVEIDVDYMQKLMNKLPESQAERNKYTSAYFDGLQVGINRRRQKRLFTGILSFVVLAAILTAIYQIVSLSSLTFAHHVDYQAEVVHVTFDDCKGIDTAKNELNQVVQYLKTPEKYISLGGKLPKGVLLVGPPGTGKTLLARAVAGEAGVPFFYVSGAEFDDIFVGQGARRVKQLFKAAKEKAPAVIFIDEIDSVGRKRTSSLIQPYANQTINQLLAEMDGFVRNEGIIVLGATNKRNMLDNALLRPGRFDVQIFIDRPDYKGRKEIINYYLAKVLSRNIDVDLVARKTVGFTGSEIENLINQAALNAASSNADFVTMEHLDYARDKVTLGPDRELDMDEEKLRNIAYHESGHALVAFYTKGAHPIHKISIVPKGPSLGHVSYIPEKDGVLQTKTVLKAYIDVALGGRVAEELSFGPNDITTGASNDLQKANKLAEDMVKYYGMSEKIGLRVEMIDQNEKVNIGSAMTNQMDTEIKQVLQESNDRVKALLTSRSKELILLAETLLKYETLTGEQVKALLTKKKMVVDPTIQPRVDAPPM